MFFLGAAGEEVDARARQNEASAMPVRSAVEWIGWPVCSWPIAVRRTSAVAAIARRTSAVVAIVAIAIRGAPSSPTRLSRAAVAALRVAALRVAA